MTYDDAFSALGDPTRRQVFEAVAKRPRAVGALAAELPVSRPAVSQHLRVLSDAGLVMCRAEGTRRIYAARPEGLAEMRAWLERYWSDVLESFAAEVNEGGRASDGSYC
ncbi:helix-turn-helix transcriptional regulator [Ruegeria sp. EL01]|jgi:DNA-binding transcriptional ArsR family regulator|uniref:ArsR/SmtB family transcription factor n=1 Tax=Ruegeria sp. EL01 TaxID=2107578 RepID=UPI000EA82A36|nr:metalloregulator ArsR/SmtB family transcription factor [Ruegeria sp. EL01]